MFVYIGSYTMDGDGGILVARHDPLTGVLEAINAVRTVAPSFLAWHPDGHHLYAVNETKEGSVTAYHVDEHGHLHALNSESTGGVDPCHLVVHPAGRHLLVANYGSGSVAVHPIRPDGSVRPRSDLVQHQGHGPQTDRQAGPHTHQVRIAPDGEHVLAADLGTDSVFVYRLDLETGKLAPAGSGRTEPGAGPRHLVFGPQGTIHVACELDSTVTTFSFDAATGSLVRRGSVPSTVEKATAENYPSEIVRSDDGGFVYVANRGQDVVTVFTATGAELRPTADVLAGGRWPRHLAFVGEYLYVANQETNQVTCFRLDPHTGIPQPTGAALDIPAPACIMPEPKTT